MLSVEDLRQLIFNLDKPSLASELVNLEHCANRFAAENIDASVNVPPAANSAMDGYALWVDPSQGSIKNQSIKISQSISPGNSPPSLQANTCARILTGAELPEGSNAVVIQEDVETLEQTVIVRTEVQQGDNVRPAGQDIQKGQSILTKGDKLSPAKLGVLAACGIGQVRVFKRPRVAIVNTGNELIQPGDSLNPGQIYNSNYFVLRAQLNSMGCECVEHRVLKDDLNSIKHNLLELSSTCDIIISSGGVSVGDYDFVKTAIESLGELQHWKVKLKPGKPIAIGHINKPTDLLSAPHSDSIDTADTAKSATKTTPIFALPGNPVSSFVCTSLFVKAYLESIYKRPFKPLIAQTNSDPSCGTGQHSGLRLAANFSIERERSRPEFARVKIINNRIHMLSQQSSGAVSSLDLCDGLALIPDQRIIQPGDLLDYFPLNTFSEIH